MRPRSIRRTMVAPTSGRRSSTDNLADYNNSLGDMVALPKDLTLQFKDVVAQIFPLAAELSTMQQFLDDYLNCPRDGEDPPVYFKPAAPFVLLEVCNYNSMASNAENVGWFSQHEIAFGMPLEWYARDGDNLQFLKYALIYPYIFVDNPLSLSGGRQIYGWSKAPIEVEPLASVFEPATIRTLLSIKLLTPGNTPDAPDGWEYLLRLRQSRYLQAAASALPDILTALPRAITASVNAAFDLVQFAGGAPISYASSQIRTLQSMLPRFYGNVGQYLPPGFCAGGTDASSGVTGSPVSLITLKQVRELEDPNQTYRSLACYQGIVESKMQIDRLTDGGAFLDPVNPDPAGGVYIDLFGEKPDLLKLGIVSQAVTTDDWKQVRRLTPLLPFWLKMDLSCGVADYQAWRTSWTSWTSNNSPQLRPKEYQISYVALGSGAMQEIPPPKVFPSVTLRVLPLQAEGTALDTLINSYLANKFYEFKRVGNLGGHAVVCLILSNFAKMMTAVPQDGYKDFELTFAIPVHWTRIGTRQSGIGLIPAYTFVATYWNAITTFEVYGRLTLKSTFVSPPFTAILPPRAGAQGNLGLTLMTELFPELNKTQPLQDLPLLEIHSIYPIGDTHLAALRDPAEVAIENFLNQVGLPEFHNTQKFYSIALKQVRDANDTAKADFQSGVWLERTFTQTDSWYYSPELQVRIYDYPNLQLVDKLGLIVDSKLEGAKPAKRICVLSAKSPFYLDGTMQCGAPMNAWWQVGKPNWQVNASFNP